MHLNQETKDFLESSDAYRGAAKTMDTAKTLMKSAKFREEVRRLLHLPKFRELSKDKLNDLLSVSLRNNYNPSYIVRVVERMTQEHLVTLAHQQFCSQLRHLKVGESNTFVTTTGKRIIITKAETEVKAQLLDGFVIVRSRSGDNEDLFFEKFESGPNDIIDVLVKGKPVLEKTALNHLKLFVGNREGISNGFPYGFQAGLLLSRIRSLSDKQELTRVLPNRLRLTVRREGYHYKIETSVNVSFTLSNRKYRDGLHDLACALTNFSRYRMQSFIRLAAQKIYFYNDPQTRNSENIQIVADCLYQNIEPRIHALVVGRTKMEDEN